MIRDKSNIEHYFGGNNCQGWKFLDKNSLSVIEEEMVSHSAEKHHFHKYDQQLFYIISGIAEFELENKRYEVKADRSFYVGPKLKHRIINNIDKPLKFLVISQPFNMNDRHKIKKD